MLSLPAIMALNQLERDQWVQKAIECHFVPGSVLDVGAGTAPYRRFLGAFRYISHDFGKYEGVKLGGVTEYASIDVVSDIVDIPLATSGVDNLLCTEVLEHVPDPIRAIQEFSRLLRPGGVALITTPFPSGAHRQPFHYYAGFSPQFFQWVAERTGFEVVECMPHGGFPRLIAQELARLDALYQRLGAVGFNSSIADRQALLTQLANELLALDKPVGMHEFCIGHHVILRRVGA